MTVANRRRIDPSQLDDSIPGELDWLIMKALEKDRRRRYESASGLADDIRVSVLSSHVDGEGSVVGFFARSGETHDTIARPSTRPAVARATRAI